MDLKTDSIPTNKTKNSEVRFTFYMIIGIILTIIVSALSISFGAANMSVATAWSAIFDFEPSITDHQIIMTLRAPRTVADLIVGANLAVCGALMQGTTRNPLADSGLMGISSGAAIATSMTYFIASVGKKGMTPQRLVLAGISISMLFGALSQFIALRFRIGRDLVYWTAGGTAGATWNELLVIVPFFLIGIIGSIALSPSVTVMSLGEDVAIGIGLKTKFVKAMSIIIVLVLTGLSVIVVGPVSFVGLITPHIVRYIVGVDYRYIIPASVLYGALLTASADLIGRLINRPFETPIGIIFSVIGVPYFLFLARRQRREFD
ncbi:MAG: FecCD family ABC transporter permease [Lachnospirales bacterium]